MSACILELLMKISEEFVSFAVGALEILKQAMSVADVLDEHCFILLPAGVGVIEAFNCIILTCWVVFCGVVLEVFLQLRGGVFALSSQHVDIVCKLAVEFVHLVLQL